MENQTIIQFLQAVLALFNGTLSAVLGQPVLSFLLAFELFLVMYALVTWMARLGQRGKL